MKIILVQNYFLEKLKKPKIKNSIILIGVLLPALQALYFIHLFGVNIPWRDDFGVAEQFHLFFSNDPYWLERVFQEHNIHRMFFPNLIFLVNAFLTSWNLKVQMFLGWAFIGISLILLYLLLNKTHSNFRWLIIPFSIIMYSPGQWQNLLWGFQLQWFLVVTCIFCTIYLINLGGKLNFFISIGLGIIASFSLVHGLFIWPIGILSILFWKQKIKYLAIWISTSALVFFIYFFNFTLPQNREIILSSKNIDQFFVYVFTFLGSGLSSNIFFRIHSWISFF